jgi:hypothetical protein
LGFDGVREDTVGFPGDQYIDWDLFDPEYYTGFADVLVYDGAGVYIGLKYKSGKGRDFWLIAQNT